MEIFHNFRQDFKKFPLETDTEKLFIVIEIFKEFAIGIEVSKIFDRN